MDERLGQAVAARGLAHPVLDKDALGLRNK